MTSKISSICALALIQAAFANEFQLPEDFSQQRDDDFVESMLEASLADEIDKLGYFRSEAYQHELTADEKMQKLWKMILPDPDVEEEPMDFYWNKFDNFFKQKAQGSFCNESDEMPKNRLKTTHTQGIVA